MSSRRPWTQQSDANSRSRPGWIRGLFAGAAMAAIGLASQSHAQDRSGVKVYPDASHTADTLLRNADNQAANAQYAAAIEIYQRVIAQFGDKVVEVPPDKPAPEGEASHLYVDARLDCQRRIAALPPEGRAIYRSRVDPQAERWFKQGLAERDRVLLRRVVDEAYCSSWGDDALELLGDLAFQDGRFSDALAAYQRLVPNRAGPGMALIHPDPSIDLAKVAAKVLLTRSALGLTPSPADLDAFTKAYPNAKGMLAGRDGELYSQVLGESIKSDGLMPLASSDSRWPTFAGAPSRTRIAPGSLDVGSLQWQVELEPATSATSIPMRRQFPGGFRNRGPQFTQGQPPPSERLLAYHPIILGDQVVICTQKEVLAYDLNQRQTQGPGLPPIPIKPAWRQENQGGVDPASRQFQTIPRFTLTAFGNRIFARMGPPPSLVEMNFLGRGGGFGQRAANESAVVALSRNGDGKLLWRRLASEIELPKRRGGDEGARTAVFEGSPIVDESGVYVAMTDRLEMTAAYVICLDPETGATRWVRYICEANANVDRIVNNSAIEISHRLLTLDGSTIYFQTNLGAVAAVDTQNGSVKWIASYPWDGKATNGQERDLNPAVVVDGMVIIAPEDTPAILAYDAQTGRMLWKTKSFPEEVKLTHLLGVAKGRVVATGNRVFLFDLKTGDLVQAWPDSGQAPEGFGRGVLSGEKIYWPTKNEIHVLDQGTGLRTDPPIKLLETFGTTGGNLAVGDGFLVIAQENALVVFCQNRRLIERYQLEIARAPDLAVNYYRLAQAAESSGMAELALTNLDIAVKKSRPSEIIDGQPLVEAARDHQHHLLYRQGFASRDAKNWGDAELKFAKAAEIARTARDRLSARLEQAESQLQGNKSKAAMATLQAVLADSEMRPIVVEVADSRRSVRADLLVVDRQSAIIKNHGRAAYEEFDREAEAIAKRCRADREARLLEELTRVFPLARSVPESLMAVGEIYESQGLYPDAIRVYKRFQALEASEDLEIKGLLALARCYEAQKLWVPARATYIEARNRFPGARTLDGSTELKVADLVARKLASQALQRVAGDPVEPSVAMPLVRLYQRDWVRAVRPIAADGVPPSNDSGRLFLVEGSKLSPVDPGKDRPSWTFDLESEPVWVGYLADRIIAATRSKIVALSLSKGTPDWEFEPDRSGPERGEANFFDRLDPDGNGGTNGLQDFKIVGNRILCLKGDQAIFAIDGDSGQVDWTFTPMGGRFNPRWLVGPNKIVLQVAEPNKLLVLETATGRKLAEHSLGVETEWKRDPFWVDDDHVLVVSDSRSVTLYDLKRADPVWKFQEAHGNPTYGPPQVFLGSRHLLVLYDGLELISLDPANGAKRWARMISDTDMSKRPESMQLGADRFYFVSYGKGARLSAINLADGKTAWSQAMIGLRSGWALALTEKHVVAYPNLARLIDDDLPAWPIVIRRRDQGALVQRLMIPTRPLDTLKQGSPSDLTVKLSPKGALIATRSGLWSLIERSP